MVTRRGLIRLGILLERSEILDFVKNMKTRDHVVLIFSDLQDKRDVVFTYLKSGLEKGEAAAYVASQETPEEIRQAMTEFGIDVEGHERDGTLKVIDYRDWYIIDGKFDCFKTLSLWRELFEESKMKGFRGFRVTGETACFFDRNLLNELLGYERELHRVLDLPMTAICAYDSKMLVSKEEWFNVLIELLNTHSTAIMLGPEGVGAVSPRNIIVGMKL